MSSTRHAATAEAMVIVLRRRRFKAGVVAGLYPCGNAGHGEGRADEQRKARRHSGSHGDRIAPQPFLSLNFGDAPLGLRNALLMTPHL